MPNSIAPSKRLADSTFGKIGTSFSRHLISWFKPSMKLVLLRRALPFLQWFIERHLRILHRHSRVDMV